MSDVGDDSKSSNRRRSAIFAFRSAAAAKLYGGSLAEAGENAACCYAMYSWGMTPPATNGPTSEDKPTG